ncbi:MAG: hypothetical protein ABI251_15975 [Mycobacteriaceae bacterium]
MRRYEASGHVCVKVGNGVDQSAAKGLPATTSGSHTVGQRGGHITELVRSSGRSRSAFVAAIGTSPPYLSTYCRGAVTPSAALLLRTERVAQRAASH